MSDKPTASAIVQDKRVVIFDLFHTLTALETTWGDGRPLAHQMLGVSQEAWDEQLHEKSRSRLAGQMSDPVQIVAEMAWAIDPGISDERIRAAVANRIERFAGAMVNIPAVTERTLRCLKSHGKHLGLVSNADVMEVAAWPRSPIAALFDAVVFSCEVGAVKPEKEIYEICLRRLGVTGDECAFVGDGGFHELEGARNVGMTTIMITGIIREIWPDRIDERRPHADAVIETLDELIPGGSSAH